MRRRIRPHCSSRMARSWLQIRVESQVLQRQASAHEQKGFLPPSALPEPPGNTRLVQVVRRHFHLHMIADGEAHPALAHFAANRRQYHVLVREFNPEHRARQDNRYNSFHFNMLFFCLCHFCLSVRSASIHRSIPANHPEANRKKRTRNGFTQTSFLKCLADDYRLLC